MSRLDEIKARAEAATAGPWEFTGRMIPGVLEYDYPSYQNDYIPAISMEATDAEFIAHARTDVPVLVAAVEAVLELHKPWAVSNPSESTVNHCCDQCYEAGTGDFVPYPCPTVAAIQSALREVGK